MGRRGLVVEQSHLEIRAILTRTQQETFDDRVRQLDGRMPEELREH